PNGPLMRRFSLATGEVTTLSVSPDQLRNYVAPAFDTDGTTLYVMGSHELLKVDLGTDHTSTVDIRGGCGGSEARADGIGSVACLGGLITSLRLDGRGSLYLADGDSVRRIDLATLAVTTVVGDWHRQPGVRLGALPAGLNAPAALAFAG